MLVCRDLQTLTSSDRESFCNTPRSTEVPRPKYAVSVGLVTLAEDKRPEANLLIGLSAYAFQHYTSR